MKRGSTWLGILGALAILLALLIGLGLTTKPDDVLLVNVAVGVPAALWLVLGVFLIFVSLKVKQREDSGYAPAKFEPNSPEDKELLRKRQNWILGLVLLFEIISSSEGWILNHYSAGFTYINILTVCDILFNIAILYTVVQLFKDAKGVSKFLFYLIITYGVVEGILIALIGDWWGVGSDILFTLYFVYALQVPLNRKNFRIAHWVFLPAMLIVTSFVLPYFHNLPITRLNKNLSTLVQQYSVDNGQASSEYAVFTQQTLPTTAMMQDIQQSLVSKDSDITQTTSTIRTIEALYEKQLPSVSQQQSLEQLQETQAVLDLDSQQDQQLGALIHYALNVDFTAITQDEITAINNFELQISSLEKQIEVAGYKLQNS